MSSSPSLEVHLQGPTSLLLQTTQLFPEEAFFHLSFPSPPHAPLAFLLTKASEVRALGLSASATTISRDPNGWLQTCDSSHASYSQRDNPPRIHFILPRSSSRRQVNIRVHTPLQREGYVDLSCRGRWVELHRACSTRCSVRGSQSCMGLVANDATAGRTSSRCWLARGVLGRIR